MTKKEFDSAIAMTEKTKFRFDALKKYLGSPSGEELLNRLMDFFMKRKKITNYKLNKFKKRFI